MLICNKANLTSKCLSICAMFDLVRHLLATAMHFRVNQLVGFVRVVVIGAQRPVPPDTALPGRMPLSAKLELARQGKRPSLGGVCWCRCQEGHRFACVCGAASGGSSTTTNSASRSLSKSREFRPSLQPRTTERHGRAPQYIVHITEEMSATQPPTASARGP